MYTGKGGGGSKQKPTSIVLVTSFLCLKCLQGGRGGQIVDLFKRTDLMDGSKIKIQQSLQQQQKT